MGTTGDPGTATSLFRQSASHLCTAGPSNMPPPRLRLRSYAAPSAAHGDIVWDAIGTPMVSQDLHGMTTDRLVLPGRVTRPVSDRDMAAEP